MDFPSISIDFPLISIDLPSMSIHFPWFSWSPMARQVNMSLMLASAATSWCTEAGPKSRSESKVACHDMFYIIFPTRSLQK